MRRAEQLNDLYTAVCACPGISIGALSQAARVESTRLPDLLGRLVCDGLIRLGPECRVWPAGVQHG